MSEFTSCDDCIRDSGVCIRCAHNYTNLFKPKQKVIKLDEMVGTDIDMEFSNMATPFIHTHDIYIGELTGFDESIPGKKFYIKDKVGQHYTCRIRQDHWHHWNGGNCPLPEGLNIKVKFRDGYESIENMFYLNINNWFHDNRIDGKEIIAFKILGVVSRYKYEWMDEEKET